MFKAITYGLDSHDIARRASEKNFRPVGMNAIIETNAPNITANAIARATSRNYAAVAIYRFTRQDEQEVSFKLLGQQNV